jgi:hypothetical protein
LLVTTGYLLKPASANAAAPQPSGQAAATPAAAPASPAPPPPVPATAAAVGAGVAGAIAPAGATAAAADRIDVAGIRLGMSLEEARAVLKAKGLRQYDESAQTLSFVDSGSGGMHSLADGRFVNVIATWTPPAAADSFEASGESFEVMFTPVPGKERVMAIVHSVGYTPANAIRESTLEDGLVKKYGGFSAAHDLPASPTWRFQNGGVQVGDACNRRGLFGGLGGLQAANPPRANLALKASTEELQFQVAHCGSGMVTEDHFVANGGALREDRLVTRFTVTAYSPAAALDGATTAARLVQTARNAHGKTEAARAKEPAPNL